ncbi:MAG: DUF5671 domain-containing protein [Patescibacteria group bacterium]|jgi:hypothetical protein
MEKTYNFARDGFMYLLSYATLLVSSVAMNYLLRGVVNHYIPDALDRTTFLGSSSELVGFLAAVVIAFPIFLYVNYSANKLLGQGKIIHDTGVRRWLLYITLVVVILVIIAQLISLFIAYFSGNLVLRSALGAVITLIIAFVVLGYQWWHLKFFDGTAKKISTNFKIFEWAVIAVVTAGVIWTFFVIDSPTVIRNKRFDDTRVQRLTTISYSIQTYYGDAVIGHRVLPTSLQQLVSDTRIFIETDGLVDPVTKQQFEYKVLAAKSYQLCATFATDNTKDAAAVNQPAGTPKFVGANSFAHPVGRKCFDLTVQ